MIIIGRVVRCVKALNSNITCMHALIHSKTWVQPGTDYGVQGYVSPVPHAEQIDVTSDTDRHGENGVFTVEHSSENESGHHL